MLGRGKGTAKQGQGHGKPRQSNANLCIGIEGLTPSREKERGAKKGRGSGTANQWRASKATAGARQALPCPRSQASLQKNRETLLL